MPHGSRVVEPSVHVAHERSVLGSVMNQASKRALDALDIGTIGYRRGLSIPCPFGTASASAVRGRIDVVHEPRFRSHRGPDPERAVLLSDEDLEVVVDDGLDQSREMGPTARMEEDGVPSQAFGHPGDGGLGAVARPRDLPMSGAGGEARGDGEEERGPLEVVGGGEGLPGAGWATHSGQGQKGGRKREGRTDSTGCRGQRMSGLKSKQVAERMPWELHASATGRGLECPPADTSDDQRFNKLAATVVPLTVRRHRPSKRRRLPVSGRWLGSEASTEATWG